MNTEPPITVPTAPATPAEPAGPATATPAAARKRTGSSKPPRRRSREFAVQGLYQWLLSGATEADIVENVALLDGFARCDRAHFDALLHGGIEHAVALDAQLHKFIDRPIGQLSPVEHAVLMIGVYELMHCIEIPFRVAINEGVELAKAFGGTDGHKYVNGVLDKAAAALRPAEARR